MSGRSTAPRRTLGLAALALLALLAVVGCARPGAEAPEPRGGLSLSFEDRPEPAVFMQEGRASRDAPDGAEGLWAAVAGLPRPERALVVNLDSGAEVVVALFRARAGGPAIRLSNAAADALGVGTAPAPVRITALRREAKLDTTPGRF